MEIRACTWIGWVLVLLAVLVLAARGEIAMLGILLGIAVLVAGATMLLGGITKLTPGPEKQ